MTAAVDKRAQAETALGGILQHMGYPARLEWKDMPDGGIGVAVHFEGELPGITASKRTSLVDCLQFLVNKMVNRPNGEKRWVTLGVNAFPEPRPARPEGGAPAPAPAASAPVASEAKAPATAKPPPNSRNGKAAPPPAAAPAARRNESTDERKLSVEPTPQMTRLATSLAHKAATTGYFYAVLSLSTDDRARALQAAASAKGVSARVEGDGLHRRLAFVPDKPTIISKKQVMPDYDDDAE
ncbi:MAG: hypothetical protein JNG84_09405 [Archangium sp.]|nr:hypothetical protein [Archangium sp.]